MSGINFKPITTLREPTELAAQGLVSVADLADLEKVAARYAVAVTPEGAALIDPDDPEDPIRSGKRRIHPSPGSCIAIRIGCCSNWFMSARSIAGSVFAARWSARARRRRSRRALTTTHWPISAHIPRFGKSS